MFSGVQRLTFGAGLAAGSIKYIDDDLIRRYYERVEEQQLNPGIPEAQAVNLILQRTAEIWDSYFDELKSHIIRSLVERVTLHDDDTIEVSWRTTDWLALLEAMKPGTIGPKPCLTPVLPPAEAAP